jgi:hypothetical protein
VTPNEVVKLIKACRASGVRELTLENFRLVMNEAGMPILTPQFLPEGKADKVEEIRKSGIIEENLSFDEDLLAHSIVENPFEYERQLIEGELEKREAEDNS